MVDPQRKSDPLAQRQWENSPLMSAEKLKNLTVKDLAQLAKRKGVVGWHSMRKKELIKALSAVAKQKQKSPSRRAAANTKSVNRTIRSRSTKSTPRGRTAPKLRKGSSNSKPARPKSPSVIRRLREARNKQDRIKNLARPKRSRKGTGPAKDRLVVMVRDPYWLHAYWDLTHQSVQRAEAALGQDWHNARPVLRLSQVAGTQGNSAAETVLRHIEIHGGVNNWYIDVQDPPKSYRVEIGYLADHDKFFALARSNIVTTPRAGAADAIDENWRDVAENFEKIYAINGGDEPGGPSHELQELFEEQLRRPMGSPMMNRYGPRANGLVHHGRKRPFFFDVDAELIVYGSTEPEASVTVQGEPVSLRPDGTFTVRFSMPNCRQVLPAVASSSDGMEQQTVVLAVERNTKVMEPVIHDNTI